MFIFTSLSTFILLAATALASPVLEIRDGSVNEIFPLGHNYTSWTTSSLVDGHLSLSDSTFRPHNAISALHPKYEKAPDNRQSMLAHFPKGAYDYKGPMGGLSFYAPGPASVDLTTAKEGRFDLTFRRKYA